MVYTLLKGIIFGITMAVIPALSMQDPAVVPHMPENHIHIAREIAPAVISALPVLGHVTNHGVHVAAETLGKTIECINKYDEAIEHQHFGAADAAAQALLETGTTYGAEQVIGNAIEGATEAGVEAGVEAAVIAVEDAATVGVLESVKHGAKHGAAAAGIVAASNVSNSLADQLEKNVGETADPLVKEGMEDAACFLRITGIPARAVHAASSAAIDGTRAVGRQTFPTPAEIYTPDTHIPPYGQTRIKPSLKPQTQSPAQISTNSPETRIKDISPLSSQAGTSQSQAPFDQDRVRTATHNFHQAGTRLHDRVTSTTQRMPSAASTPQTQTHRVSLPSRDTSRRSSVMFADQESARCTQSFLDGAEYLAEGLEVLGYGRQAKATLGIAENFVKAASHMEKIGLMMQNDGDQAIMGSAAGAGSGAMAAQSSGLLGAATPFVGVAVAGYAIMNCMMALEGTDAGPNPFDELKKEILSAIYAVGEQLSKQIARFERGVHTRLKGIEHFLQTHHKVMVSALLEIKWDTGDIKSELRAFKQKTEESQRILLGQLSSVQEAIGGVHRLVRSGFSNSIILDVKSMLNKARAAQLSKSVDHERFNEHRLLLADAATDIAHNHLLTAADTDVTNYVAMLSDLNANYPALVVNLLMNYVNKYHSCAFEGGKLVNPIVWEDCATRYAEMLTAQFAQPTYPDEDDRARDMEQLRQLLHEGEQLLSFIEHIDERYVLQSLATAYTASLTELARLIETECDEFRVCHTRILREELIRLHKQEKALVDHIVMIEFPEYTRQITFANEIRNRVLAVHPLRRVRNGAYAIIRYHGQGPNGYGWKDADGHCTVPDDALRERRAFASGVDRCAEKQQEKDTIAQRLRKSFLEDCIQCRHDGLSQLTKDDFFVYTGEETISPDAHALMNKLGSPTWIVRPRNTTKNKLMFTLPSGIQFGSIYADQAAFLHVGTICAEWEVREGHFWMYLMHEEIDADQHVTRTPLETYKMPYDQPGDSDEDVWHFLHGGTYARAGEDEASYDLFISDRNEGDEWSDCNSPIFPEERFFKKWELRTTPQRHMMHSPPEDQTTIHTMDLYPPYTMRAGHYREIKDHAVVVSAADRAQLDSRMQAKVKTHAQKLHADMYRKIVTLLEGSSSSAIAQVAQRATVQYKIMQLLARLTHGDSLGDGDTAAQIPSHPLLVGLVAQSSRTDLAQARTIEDMRCALISMIERGVVRSQCTQGFSSIKQAISPLCSRTVIPTSTETKKPFGKPAMPKVSAITERLRALLTNYPAAVAHEASPPVSPRSVQIAELRQQILDRDAHILRLETKLDKILAILAAQSQ